jgi:hypothetical protein
MIGYKLPNKTKSATVAEHKLFHQLNNPLVSMYGFVCRDRGALYSRLLPAEILLTVERFKKTSTGISSALCCIAGKAFAVTRAVINKLKAERSTI